MSRGRECRRLRRRAIHKNDEGNIVGQKHVDDLSLIHIFYGNGAGYEADIYGAVLGFDYTAACGGTLGVAFNVGDVYKRQVWIRMRL